MQPEVLPESVRRSPRRYGCRHGPVPTTSRASAPTSPGRRRPPPRAHLWTLLSDTAADLVLWLPTWHGGGFAAAGRRCAPRPDRRGCLTTSSASTPRAVGGRSLDRAAAARRVVADRVDGAPAAVRGDPGAARRPACIGVVGGTPRDRRCAIGPLEQAISMPPTSHHDGRPSLRRNRWRARDPRRASVTVSKVSCADEEGIVTFASPNARSAYHRLGLATDLVGVDLARTSAEAFAASRAGRRGARGRRGRSSRGWRRGREPGAVVTLRGVPLVRRRRRSCRCATRLRSVAATAPSRRRTPPSARSTHREEQPVDRRRPVAAAGAPDRQPRGPRCARRGCAGSARSPPCTRPSWPTPVGERVDVDEVADRLSRACARHVGRGAGVGAPPGQLQACSRRDRDAAVHGARRAAAERGRARRRQRRGSSCCPSRTLAEKLVVDVVDAGPGIPEAPTRSPTSRLGLQIVRTLVTEGPGGRLELLPAPTAPARPPGSSSRVRDRTG